MGWVCGVGRDSGEGGREHGGEWEGKGGGRKKGGSDHLGRDKEREGKVERAQGDTQGAPGWRPAHKPQPSATAYLLQRLEQRQPPLCIPACRFPTSSSGARPAIS